MKRFLICTTVLFTLACVSFADACGRRGRGSRGGGCDGGDCGGGMQFVSVNPGCNSCGQAGYRVQFGGALNDGCGRIGCICLGNNCPDDCSTNGCVACNTSNCSFYGTSATPGFVTIKVCRGNRNCKLVDVPATGVGTTWQSFPDLADADLFALYHNGNQIGTWNAAQRWYAPYDAAARTFAAKVHWDAPAQSYASTPAPNTNAEDPFSTPGAGTPTTSTSTPQETQRPAFGAIWPTPSAQSNVKPTGPSPVELPTDKDLPFAELTSDDAALCAQFRNAWNSEALYPWKNRFRVKTMATADPMQKDRDGQLKWHAKPGLYFEAKDGTALGQMSIEDYAGSPEMLVFALNQIDPQFNPALVPDLAHLPEPETLSEEFAEYWPAIRKAAFLLALGVTAIFACVYAVSAPANRGTDVPVTFASDVH